MRLRENPNVAIWHQATDTKLNRQVALKILPENWTEGLTRLVPTE